MLQTQRKVATKFVKAHRHMSRRGHFVSGDLYKKLCLCTTSLVLSTRTAVHKKSFFNFVRQNSRHVTKVYSGRMVRLICFSLHCSGFKVTLFVDAAEYVGPLADSVGAVVSVYLPLTKSNTMGENPIYVAPGSFVSVSLNAVRRLIYLCPSMKLGCNSTKHNKKQTNKPKKQPAASTLRTRKIYISRYLLSQD